MKEAPKGMHSHGSLIPLEYQASTARIFNSFHCLPTRRFINSLPLMPFGNLHSPFLGAESHITQAAFYSQCKTLEGNKLHQPSAWFSKSLSHCSSFPVALQLKLFGSLLMGLFSPLAFCLGGCGHSLPSLSLFFKSLIRIFALTCVFSPASAETAKSLLQGHVYTHLIVTCSLAYNESHRTAQMNLKGFRMQGTVVKIILGYNQKGSEKWIPQHIIAFQQTPSMCIWKVLLLFLMQITVCSSFALFSH